MPEADEPSAKRARAPLSAEALDARLEATPVHAKLPEGLGAFICTHHGTFHADEAMACAMLKCLPEYAAMPILRTRDQTEIEKAAVVVDVGGTYEPAKHRYDHHQREFVDTWSSEYPEIRLSSAGLVFRHFGPAVIETLCGPLEAGPAAAILAKTYDSLVRELDALDNGVPVADTQRYRFCTHLGARVGRLNQGWQDAPSPDEENARFRRAARLAARELCDIIQGYSSSWLPARSLVERALEARAGTHPSGEVLQLERFCPWQEHLFDLEEERAEEKAPLAKYVIFQDSRAGWRVQAVPKARGSFESRRALPDAWRGLRDAELSERSGIPGCVFVHAGGFIGGNASAEGALRMAADALGP